MCGIAGYYAPNGKFAKGSLEQMTATIAHRGPDASGLFHSEALAANGLPLAGLGHRRLSIIDLQTRANQPMTSRCGRFTIIYNGEVYNFRQIATDIKNERPDFEFRTSSDTEVILEAFAIWGKKSVDKLNGIFAYAIYDHKEEELFLCRDRVGVKPIFYSWDGSDICFASELKSITALPSVKLELNRREVSNFLHFGFIPTPFTIYKNIFKLPAGCYVTVSKKGFRYAKYWELADKVEQQTLKDHTQALVQLADLVSSSVQYQLISDVPFGVFLSGGIDSSLITAQAVQQSSVKVNTFSIGFKENRYDESKYAAEVAKYLGTDHHEFIVSYNDAIDLLSGLDEVYDEPYADSSAIPTMLVAKLARSKVTVTLSGEGGDELFFGYGSYRWVRRLNNPMVRIMKEPIASLLQYTDNRYKRATEMFRKVPAKELYSHVFSQEQYYFSTYELNDLMQHHAEDLTADSTIQHFRDDLFLENYNKLIAQLRSARSLDAMEQQSLFDIYCYLQDDLLVKVDRASMRYGLETRVPYLDHRIIEFALNLSPDLKYRNGTAKFLLKEILFSYVPKKYFDRPKQGFAIPLQNWLLNELSFLIEENLNENVLSHYNLVNPVAVKELIRRFRAGDYFLYNRIWLLIVLHKWLKKNIA